MIVSFNLRIIKHLILIVCVFVASGTDRVWGEAPAKLHPWLTAQAWERDTSGPIVSLGAAGEFDDVHIFAPCVALLDHSYHLWYCGSRGAVAERVFRVGLATSSDGKQFDRHANNPVLEFGDGRHSIMTPTLLRHTDGIPIREMGKLRMWFSSTDFLDQGPQKGLHTLHESTSNDGISWSRPSRAQLENVYAPTILKDGDIYRLWYTDVSIVPWQFRHAKSSDGFEWTVDEIPVVSMDQSWENRNLFYPTVVKSDDVYLMYYGSYLANNSDKTAIGCAASLDGITWHKNPHNPVLRPDPEREWESNYTTSQSLIRNADGSWRIWYASRKKPPFVNKYFAINTARWAGPTAK